LQAGGRRFDPVRLHQGCLAKVLLDQDIILERNKIAVHPVRPVVVLHVLYENREEKTGSGFLCWKRRKGTLINPLPMIGGLTAAIGSVSRSWSFCQEFMAFAGYEDILATDGYWQ
jgi:hypothetical protein